MTVSSPTELIRALLDEAFDKLVGTHEGQWLDFKEYPPNLRDPREKWKLAKNVAAFANAGSGYIVFGVRTQRHVNEVVEAADQVVTFRKDSVDVDACRKVIQSLVYPPLVGLGLDFYPGRKEADEGLLVIEISPQESRSVPFILRKALDSKGTVTGGVAIPVRDGDQTTWWSAEHVHELITHGLRPSAPRLPDPNLPKGGIPKKDRTGPATGILGRVEEILDRVEQLQEWEDRPTYALIAMPNEATDVVPSLYGEDGLARLLLNPPSLRDSGFNLQTAGKLETVEGAVMARTDYKAQILDRTGVFAAVVPGDRSFLQWGVNDGVLPERRRINTLTLAEFTYEFFRLASEFKGRLEVRDWTHRLLARRFKTAGAELESGLARPGAGHFGGNAAKEDDLSYEWADLGSPEKNATRALATFYAIFERGRRDFEVFTTDGEVAAEAILAAAEDLK